MQLVDHTLSYTEKANVLLLTVVFYVEQKMSYLGSIHLTSFQSMMEVVKRKGMSDRLLRAF